MRSFTDKGVKLDRLTGFDCDIMRNNACLKSDNYHRAKIKEHHHKIPFPLGLSKDKYILLGGVT